MSCPPLPLDRTWYKAPSNSILQGLAMIELYLEKIFCQLLFTIQDATPLPDIPFFAFLLKMGYLYSQYINTQLTVLKQTTIPYATALVVYGSPYCKSVKRIETCIGVDESKTTWFNGCEFTEANINFNQYFAK